MKEKVPKFNIEKYFLRQTEMEYLGFWVPRNGAKPINRNIEAIKNMTLSNSRREGRKFIGVINYYRYMWPRRSHMLAPLTKLTSVKRKFKCTEVEQDDFDKIKRIVAHDNLLTYPDFNETFKINTDASAFQLGAVISQKVKPINLYIRKLTDAQQRYIVIQRELLTIVENLKKFRTILLGQKLQIYTDHKNLTCKIFNTGRLLRWRLILEEYVTYI